MWNKYLGNNVANSYRMQVERRGTLVAVKYLSKLDSYYTKMRFSIITKMFVILSYTNLTQTTTYYIKG